MSDRLAADDEAMCEAVRVFASGELAPLAAAVEHEQPRRAWKCGFQ